MNPIIEWASRYGIPHHALQELSDILNSDTCVKQDTGYSEAAVSSKIRLQASKRGIRLFRNNVGACESADGRQIRYGLANESQRMNKIIKSADLIGITPVYITPGHVGKTLGVFTSIEVKKADWVYTGKGREVAQKKWCDIINTNGGFAMFANSENCLDEIHERT